MAKRKPRKKDPLVTEDGRLIFKDAQGNQVVQRLSKRNEARVKGGKRPVDFSTHFPYRWKKNKNGTLLLVRDSEDATNLPDSYELFPRTPEAMLTVVQLVADGKTLRTIGTMEGMPPTSVVMRWCDQDESFKKTLDEARKCRAEVYHDALEKVALDVREDTARSSKVKADILRFLASVNDKDRFGQQAKVAIDASQPINIVFHTGIERGEPLKAEAVKETIDLEKIVPGKIGPDEPKGD